MSALHFNPSLYGSKPHIYTFSRRANRPRGDPSTLRRYGSLCAKSKRNKPPGGDVSSSYSPPPESRPGPKDLLSRIIPLYFLSFFLMKTLAILTLLAISCPIFAATNYGIVSVVHKTTRTKSLVCAIDVVTLSNGKVMTDKSCFKI